MWSISEKAHSQEINIQYAEGAAAMPRRGGRRRVECVSIEPEIELIGGRTEHDYSEAIEARGTRILSWTPKMRQLAKVELCP